MGLAWQQLRHTGHRRPAREVDRTAASDGVLDFGHPVRLVQQVLNFLGPRIGRDGGPIRQASSRLPAPAELTRHLHVYSVYRDAPYGGLAVDIVAVAGRERQGEQLAPFTLEPKPPGLGTMAMLCSRASVATVALWTSRAFRTRARICMRWSSGRVCAA